MKKEKKWEKCFWCDGVFCVEKTGWRGKGERAVCVAPGDGCWMDGEWKDERNEQRVTLQMDGS
jgi:hypothetical protein